MSRLLHLAVTIGLAVSFPAASLAQAQKTSPAAQPIVPLTAEEEARLPSARVLARAASPPDLLLERNMEGWEVAGAKRFANDPVIRRR